MATYTLTIDAELLEAAKVEAERRNKSLDQMFSEYIAAIAHHPETERNADNLIRLMEEGLFGDVGKLPTREEIYEERMQWPRS
jgi:hypothetical protein